MREYKLQIVRVENGQESLIAERHATVDREPSEDGEQSLCLEMLAEFDKALSSGEFYDDIPDLSVNLTHSPRQKIDLSQWSNVRNTAALWLEISNTVADIRFLLAQARAYKQLEPPVSATDNAAKNLRYYAHFAKMYHFNLAVLGVVKMQDLVVRLLFENFGGELVAVNMASDGWEKKLTFDKAKKGLAERVQQRELTSTGFDLIMAALEAPSKSPHLSTIVDYRNRLTHRIRASVDYSELYTELEDRVGRPIFDENGKTKGRVYSMGVSPGPPEHLFHDLYASMLDLLAHILEMLTALKAIARLA